MTLFGRITALVAAVSAVLVTINHYHIARLALSDSDYWDGGRGAEAVRLTVGVFMAGGLVMTLAAGLAIVGLVAAGRNRRASFWLLLVPAVFGLVTAGAASGVWGGLQPGGSRYLAYIAVPLVVPSLLALVAALLFRPGRQAGQRGSAVPVMEAARTAQGGHAAGRPPIDLAKRLVLLLLVLALLLPLPASASPMALPDRDPATLDEAVGMVRSLKEAGASDLRVSGWLSGVLDRRIVNNNDLERMSIPGNWFSAFTESASDAAFREWRDRNETDYRTTAAWAWENRVGQCSEHAATAYYILKQAGVAGEPRLLTAPGHEFVVWGMKPGADPDDPRTWGDNAWVVDGWIGRVIYPDEVMVSGYFKGRLASFSDDLRSASATVALSDRPLQDSTQVYDPEAGVWTVDPKPSPTADELQGANGSGQTASPVRKPQWKRVEAAAVNPNDERTEFYGGRADPEYFGEPRFEGKFTIYEPSEASFVVNDRWKDREYEGWNVVIRCDFDAPKEVMEPGKTYELTARFSHEGSSKEPAPGEAFVYYSPSGVVSPANATLSYYPWSPDFDGIASMTWTLTMPQGRQGDTVEIHAGLWGAPPCTVVWTYRFE